MDFAAVAHSGPQVNARLFDARDDTVSVAHRALEREVEESSLATTMAAFDLYDTAGKEVHHFHMVRSLAVAVAAGSAIARKASFPVAVHTDNLSCDFHVEALPMIEIFERAVDLLADVIGLVHFVGIFLNRRISGQIIFSTSFAVR